MIPKLDNDSRYIYIKPSVCLYDLYLESSLLQSSAGSGDGDESVVGLFDNDINDFKQGESFDLSRW